MSAVYDITRTLSQALSDLALGVPLIMENQEFVPPDAGQWAAMFMLPIPVESIGKAPTDADDNSGVMQVSLFDTDTGGLSAALLQLADTIGGEFVHGREYSFPSFNNEVVFIQNTSRGASRIEGGFLQMDISIGWISYVDR